MENNGYRPLFHFCKKPTVIAIAVLVVIFAGLLVDVSNAGGDNDNFYLNINRFDVVALKIHQNYVEEMNSDKLIRERYQRDAAHA